MLAVERGDAAISAAAGFAKDTSPQQQAKLIDEYGSPVAAVKAALKAKADRASSKIQRSVADPKRAADRADRQTERCGNVDQLLQRFFALESSGNASQVGNAMKRIVAHNFRADAVQRLRRLAAFALELATSLEEPGSDEVGANPVTPAE